MVRALEVDFKSGRGLIGRDGCVQLSMTEVSARVRHFRTQHKKIREWRPST
jgi:hypothetical protein